MLAYCFTFTLGAQTPGTFHSSVLTDVQGLFLSLSLSLSLSLKGLLKASGYFSVELYGNALTPPSDTAEPLTQILNERLLRVLPVNLPQRMSKK